MVKPDFIDTMEVVKSFVECIKDVDVIDEKSQIPEEYERKIKRSAIEEISDSKEFRVMLVASMFALRDAIRKCNKNTENALQEIKVIERRVSDKLRAMRGLS